MVNREPQSLLNYHVKDGEDQQKIVKNAMNSLPPKCPYRDAVAKETNDAYDACQ